MNKKVKLIIPGVVLLIAAITICCSSCTAARESTLDSRMEWWREARFGLFIHWGLYAIPAGEWGDETNHGEWIMNTAQIPVEEYEQFVDRFNPVKFDADAWARMARDAGMKYIVITSKHHDGFCLFDSQLTEYDIMSTPFRRDIMKELSEACRRYDLRICWYHSIMDWHHPDYLPRRGWEERSSERADFNRYLDYLHGQVTELLTNYGDIGVMWFDGEWESTWSHDYGQPLYDLCLELQSDVIVNNRVDVGRGGMAGMTTEDRYAGDFGTPEQEIPPTGLPGVDWETCMTMNRHWGYNSHDFDYKSTEDLIRRLVDIASKGGNFLLNVGPTAEGEFPAESVERLKGMGEWMSINGESIHGTKASPFDNLPWGRCTVKENGGKTKLYLHVFEWPEDGKLRLDGIGNRVRSAYLLADRQNNIEVNRIESDLYLIVPEDPPDDICSVVVLELQGKPVIYDAPLIEAVSSILVNELAVELRTGSEELSIRYTLDGSDPNNGSTLYRQSLSIEETTVIKARTFHRNGPVSGISEAIFTRVEPIPATEVDELKPGLRRTTYHGDWNVLPDFDSLRPVSTEHVSDLDLSGGQRREYVGHRFSGFIECERDAVYLFSLTSDDGSKLTIDDHIVIDNDGLHGIQERRGVAPLARGLHRVVIDWFNKTGGTALDLMMAPAGEPLQSISDGTVYYQR